MKMYNVAKSKFGKPAPNRSFVAVCSICVLAALPTLADETPKPQNLARADLPPLLEMLDGRRVRDKSQWPARRNEIKELMCDYFVGHFPDTVPAILSAEVRDRQESDESLRLRIQLTLDTKNKASFEIHLWIPKRYGPFPILLTQPRYYQMGWAEMAVRRGYLVCLYPGVDSHQQEENYPGYESVWEVFREEYPSATWTEISIKAWLGSRALDYLLDPKYGYNVADGQVAIIGFSRYAKQSLIAAAFDQRITSVVARSAGSPGASPYRFTSRNTFAEAPEDFPGDWFLPSLRSYTGREHELPIDAHGWLALVAPRHCLIHTAHHDDGEPTFAVERAYLEGRTVYQLLGHPQRLRVDYRPGGHESGPEPDLVTDVHRRRNLDWFDLSFDRGTARQSDFPQVLLHQFDWDAWKGRQTAEELKNPIQKNASPNVEVDRRARIEWALGKVPQHIEGDGQYHIRAANELGVPDSSRDRWALLNTARMPISFSGKIHGNLYYNPTIRKPAPAVIWLHPYNYPNGSNEGYGVQGATIYHRLAEKGFVVLTYDQCGFGDRLLEGPDFYNQYPSWSRLGRMVYDVRAAVDFLVDGKGQTEGQMPKIDKDQIHVLGYSLGGMVGLYATALDERIAGAASFCGFTPLRTDTDAKPTGGIRRLWQWHALQPKLGLLHGREAAIPYDFDDVLALIAPRPCLIYSPQRDRDADFDDVVACVDRARAAWKAGGQPDALTHLTPNDTNRLQESEHGVYLAWLEQVISLNASNKQ